MSRYPFAKKLLDAINTHTSVSGVTIEQRTNDNPEPELRTEGDTIFVNDAGCELIEFEETFHEAEEKYQQGLSICEMQADLEASLKDAALEYPISHTQGKGRNKGGDPWWDRRS